MAKEPIGVAVHVRRIGKDKYEIKPKTAAEKRKLSDIKPGTSRLCYLRIPNGE